MKLSETLLEIAPAHGAILHVRVSGMYVFRQLVPQHAVKRVLDSSVRVFINNNPLFLQIS